MCSRFRLRFKLHSAGMWNRSSPSSSLSAQFSLSNSSSAVTSRGVSRFCEPSSSFTRKERFLRRVGRFFPKAARLGSKSPGFSPEGAALLPTSPSFLGTARGGVQKKSPAVCLTAGDFRLWRAPQGAWRGAGLALGAGAPCPVRNAIYLFSLGRIEWCRADPDLACFYCKGRNPRSNYLRLRS